MTTIRRPLSAVKSAFAATDQQCVNGDSTDMRLSLDPVVEQLLVTLVTEIQLIRRAIDAKAMSGNSKVKGTKGVEF